MSSFPAQRAFTQEYRNSDEYKTYADIVRKVSPGLPQALVEQAIFMHKMNPRLYRDIPREEKLERCRRR